VLEWIHLEPEELLLKHLWSEHRSGLLLLALLSLRLKWSGWQWLLTIVVVLLLLGC